MKYYLSEVYSKNQICLLNMGIILDQNMTSMMKPQSSFMIMRKFYTRQEHRNLIEALSVHIWLKTKKDYRYIKNMAVGK